MVQENIRFYEYGDGLYNMVDLYLFGGKFFEYEDSHNHCDIDVDKILLYEKGDDEYVIRYNDVNKMIIAPLQLKINNFCDEIHKFKNNIALMSIQINDKEFFRKIREIWNKIIELIGINNAKDFVKYTIDDADEFIMVDVHKNRSFVEGNYRGELVIVLHSVTDNYLKASLVQVKIHTLINDIDVNKILVSKKESYGIKYSFKYFIGYNDNDIIRPLCIKLLQVTGYT